MPALKKKQKWYFLGQKPNFQKKKFRLFLSPNILCEKFGLKWPLNWFFIYLKPPCHSGCISEAASCRVNAIYTPCSHTFQGFMFSKTGILGLSNFVEVAKIEVQEELEHSCLR